MKKLLVIAALAGLAGSAMAADVYWTAQHLAGDAATWEDANNWTADFTTVYGLPGSSDNAQITGTSWLAGYPTLSTSQNVGGVYMGQITDDTEQLSTLAITAVGSLTTHDDDGWNDGIQIGWYSAATLTSAGTVDTQSDGSGGTLLGAGTAANGYGDATLNIIGGSFLTATMNFNVNSVNHLQLDDGTLTTWGMAGLHAAGQTMDITDGTLLFHTTDVNWFPWIRDLGLTGYGSEDNANLIGSHDENTWTVTAIPEPATLGMLVLVGGGMVWIRKRFMI